MTDPSIRGGRRAVFDTHVHLHPFFDLSAAFRAAHARLAPAAGPDGWIVLCLTEAAGCAMADALRSGAQPTPGWIAEPTPDARLTRLRAADGPHVLWLLAGRQIVTRERIEVLALGLAGGPADGEAAAETIRRVRSAGAIPVLPWAPGKWFFRRGRVIASLMDAFGPGGVALADTTLRPIGWPEPALFRRARREGFRILAGSDPLPFPSEASRIGRYATAVAAPAVGEPDTETVLRLLSPGGPPAAFTGGRGCPFDTALRLARHAAAKRRRGGAVRDPAA